MPHISTEIGSSRNFFIQTRSPPVQELKVWNHIERRKNEIALEMSPLHRQEFKHQLLRLNPLARTLQLNESKMLLPLKKRIGKKKKEGFDREMSPDVEILAEKEAFRTRGAT
jgi:hypothetical protein